MRTFSSKARKELFFGPGHRRGTLDVAGGLGQGREFFLAHGLAGVVQTQVRDFEPVTDAELLDPDPADWINWRRTIDGQGYSPLDQINRDNVKNLQLGRIDFHSFMRCA